MRRPLAVGHIQFFRLYYNSLTRVCGSGREKVCPRAGRFCYFMSGICCGGCGGGVVKDTLQLALTTLTACGKRKGLRWRDHQLWRSQGNRNSQTKHHTQHERCTQEKQNQRFKMQKCIRKGGEQLQKEMKDETSGFIQLFIHYSTNSYTFLSSNTHFIYRYVHSILIFCTNLVTWAMHFFFCKGMCRTF